MIFRTCTVLLLLIAAIPFLVGAQELHDDLEAILKAEVTTISREREERIMGTDASTTVQTVSARITEGERTGETVTFENDLVMLAPGDDIFINHVRTIDGLEWYVLKDVDRSTGLLILVALFVGLLLWFSRMQGLRAILSLAVSASAIVFILVPALLAGYEPSLVSLGVSALILAAVLYGTHGFGPISSIALVGTFGSVAVTSLIAWVFVDGLRLSGFGNDASVYLNFATNGSLDFSGLLLGSIIIGILGVLDDVAITQAAVVRELRRANSTLSVVELYRRAISVGRDHVGSLVNTLALAYVGAALPLVLLFSTSEAPIALSLNQEVVASELVRILVGSIGLILAVPATTIVAAWWYGTRVGILKEANSMTGAHDHDHAHHHHH